MSLKKKKKHSRRCRIISRLSQRLVQNYAGLYRDNVCAYTIVCAVISRINLHRVRAFFFCVCGQFMAERPYKAHYSFFFCFFFGLVDDLAVRSYIIRFPREFV